MRPARLRSQNQNLIVDHPAATGDSVFQRYVPLLVWIIVLSTLILTPLKILSYGFVPGGDARRHIAKAFTDKSDGQVVMLRPGFTLDHNPGWEWVLRRVQKASGWDLGQMTVFAVVATCLLVIVVALALLADALGIEDGLIHIDEDDLFSIDKTARGHGASREAA